MPTVLSAPHPRALLFKVPEEVIERLRRLFPTLRPIESLAEVHQPDWDVFITFGGIPAKLARTVHVVSFGDPGTSDYTFVPLKGRELGWTFYHLAGLSKSFALEVIVEHDLPRHVERLARPLAESQLAAPEPVSLAFGAGPFEWMPPSSFERFVSWGDGRAIAGRYQRQQPDGGWAWLVPTTDVDVIDWVSAAVDHFASIDADRFPTLAWAQAEPWVTPSEQELANEIAHVVQTLTELAATEAQLNEHHREAIYRADVGERRLLTARGSELVEAVGAAFSELGFEVQSMDEPGQAGVEDLRVTDPDYPQWIALVEVRPANQAASLDSVRRLYRFGELFEKAGGNPPSALWYVANQMVGQDPANRPAMLAAHPSDAEVFGERGGLAIDTSLLFRILMDCRRGTSTSTEVRENLRKDRGVLRWPSRPDGGYAPESDR